MIAQNGIIYDSRWRQQALKKGMQTRFSHHTRKGYKYHHVKFNKNLYKRID